MSHGTRREGNDKWIGCCNYKISRGFPFGSVRHWSHTNNWGIGPEPKVDHGSDRAVTISISWIRGCLYYSTEKTEVGCVRRDSQHTWAFFSTCWSGRVAGTNLHITPKFAWGVLEESKYTHGKRPNYFTSTVKCKRLNLLPHRGADYFVWLILCFRFVISVGRIVFVADLQLNIFRVIHKGRAK